MAASYKTLLIAVSMMAALCASACTRGRELIIRQSGDKIYASFGEEGRGKYCINHVNVYKIAEKPWAEPAGETVWEIEINMQRAKGCRIDIEIPVTPSDFDTKISKPLTKGRYRIDVDGSGMLGYGSFEIK